MRAERDLSESMFVNAVRNELRDSDDPGVDLVAPSTLHFHTQHTKHITVDILPVDILPATQNELCSFLPFLVRVFGILMFFQVSAKKEYNLSVWKNVMEQEYVVNRDGKVNKVNPNIRSLSMFENTKEIDDI